MTKQICKRLTAWQRAHIIGTVTVLSATCVAFAGSTQQHMRESDRPGASSLAQDDRDADAETELASVVKDDPLAAYDVDVRQEGMAIQEYLSLLQSPEQQE